ncbi:MAG: replication initiation protein [Methylotenera sp.]
MQAVLKRFAESIPHKPYCSDDLGYGTRIMPREAALKRRFIQPQIRGRQIGYLVFDIDRPGAALAHEAANLPAPTLTIVNPANSYAHLLYELAEPVSTTERARVSPIRYLASIEGALKAELRSDYSYSGLLTKNPLHTDWRTSCNDVSYELSTLADYVDLNKYRSTKPAQQSAGRNVTVFNAVRKSIYKIAKNFNTFEALQNEVLAQCYSINSGFADKLSDSEIKAISKSLSKYCWKNRYSLLISREAIQAIEVAATTICKELSAVEVCKFSQKEVVKRSGYSADTIQRYIANCAT